MPKLDKRGKITIPNRIRKKLGFSAGMEADVSYTNDQIIITPYNYRCKECGAEIPEGTKLSRCKKCEEKYRIRIY